MKSFAQHAQELSNTPAEVAGKAVSAASLVALEEALAAAFESPEAFDAAWQEDSCYALDMLEIHLPEVVVGRTLGTVSDPAELGDANALEMAAYNELVANRIGEEVTEEEWLALLNEAAKASALEVLATEVDELNEFSAVVKCLLSTEDGRAAGEAWVVAGVPAHLEGTAEAAGSWRGLETVWAFGDSLDCWCPAQCSSQYNRGQLVLEACYKPALAAWREADAAREAK